MAAARHPRAADGGLTSSSGPLEAFVSKFTNMRFEPAGMTDDPDIRFATSLVDYIFRRIAIEYIDYDEFCGIRPDVTAEAQAMAASSQWEISAVELKQRLDKGDKLFILDPLKASWATIGPGEQERDLRLLESEGILERIAPEEVLLAVVVVAHGVGVERKLREG